MEKIVKKEKPARNRKLKEAAGTKVKRKTLLDALQKNGGLVTYACKACGISPWFYYDQYKHVPEFKKEVDEINNNVLDLAESVVMRRMKENDLGAAQFYLKYKGRNRGYSDEINLVSEMTVTIVHES